MLVFKDSATDTSNFDTEFTSEAPADSIVDASHLTEADQDRFDGFSYRPADNGLSSSYRA